MRRRLRGRGLTDTRASERKLGTGGTDVEVGLPLEGGLPLPDRVCTVCLACRAWWSGGPALPIKLNKIPISPSFRFAILLLACVRVRITTGAGETWSECATEKREHAESVPACVWVCFCARVDALNLQLVMIRAQQRAS